MKRIYLFISVFALLSGIFLCSCDKLFPDDKLTLKRVDYNGNELKTDGYYYHQSGNGGYRYTSVLFLYRNGVILSCGAFPTTDLNIVEKEFPNKYDGGNSKYGWGLFLIARKNIEYERWTEAPSGIKYAVNKRSGYIENDMTFHITESYNSGTKETEQVNEVWHFKQFDNKPDSTNVYIK